MLKNYLFNLEFYPNEIRLGNKTQLKREVWVIISYALLSFGVLFGSAINFPSSISLNIEMINVQTIISSFIVGLALFPICMRKINHLLPTPNIIHVLTSFSFGFFSNKILDKVINSFLG